MARNKDPAVLFYTSDFLTGVSGLTMEERGQYITLLCLQHQQGHLSAKTIEINVGKPSPDVMAKFERDEDGNYYQHRMDEEIELRKGFLDKQQKNGSKGGRPRKLDMVFHNVEKTQTKPKQNPGGNENINITDNKFVANNNIFPFPYTTTTEYIYPLMMDEEKYALSVWVFDFFRRFDFKSDAVQFLEYNESRGFLDERGESIITPSKLTKYMNRWEELQRTGHKEIRKDYSDV